jgi:hypothetical protein
MNPSSLNLRTLFALPEDAPAAAASVEWQPLRERLAREAKTIKWPAAMPDLAAKIGALFDVELPALFVSSWKKASEIQQALAESEKTPGEIRTVQLAEHVWTGTYHPFIDVKLKSVPVKRIQFAVEISATLDGIELRIRNGAIEKIEAGSCEFEGRIKYEDLTIAEKKAGPLPLRDIFLGAPPANPPRADSA